MNEKTVCRFMLVPYILSIGVIGYFVTPWISLVVLGGYNCDTMKGK